jgi:hypothetical protein
MRNLYLEGENVRGADDALKVGGAATLGRRLRSYVVADGDQEACRGTFEDAVAEFSWLAERVEFRPGWVRGPGSG